MAPQHTRRWRRTLRAAMSMIVLIGSLATAQQPVPHSAPHRADATQPDTVPDLTLQLIDRRTRAPLARRAVTIYSDNGRRCIRPPCATNGEQWEGRTDARGRVRVPSRLRRESMHIWATGYTARIDLLEVAVRASAHRWTIALRRDRR